MRFAGGSLHLRGNPPYNRHLRLLPAVRAVLLLAAGGADVTAFYHGLITTANRRR